MPLELTGIAADPVGLRTLAVQALARMYRPEQGLFCFRLRRGMDGRGVQDGMEGVSGRYTAIVILALADEPRSVQKQVLSSDSLERVADCLKQRASMSEDVGEVALALWALNEAGLSGADQVLDRLRVLRPADGPWPTVELSWALSGLLAGRAGASDVWLIERIAERLLATQDVRTGLFAHMSSGTSVSYWRSHVCCFADMVYPVQALSRHYKLCRQEVARSAAMRCGERMIALQGGAGQWWWHFDIRTGRVIEKYPVYAIHQDAMGPMALFELSEACGVEVSDAVRRSMAWLVDPPEIEDSLIDRDAGVIWRKVCRREPNKLSRRMQAVVSRIHAGLRVPWGDALFPPQSVDYETRPYHMGWLLYAWSRARLELPTGARMTGQQVTASDPS